MLPFGSTFRMRLRCALALARTQPKTNLLGRGASKYVYEQSLGICRHYPTISSTASGSRKRPDERTSSTKGLGFGRVVFIAIVFAAGAIYYMKEHRRDVAVAVDSNVPERP